MASATANFASHGPSRGQVIKFPRARKRGAKVRNGPLAAIFEFPLTACSIDEVIEQYIVATARYNPQLYPGGLPRDGGDRSFQAMYSVVPPEQQRFLRNLWIEDTNSMNADLAQGITSQGNNSDPEVQRKIYESCVRNYGPPEEGYSAWAPLLRKLAAQHAAGASNGTWS